MKICIAQLDLTVGNIAGNAAQIAEAMHIAKQQGAQILLTPELALSGYPPEDLLLRDDFHTQLENALDALCAISDGITLVLGHPSRHGLSIFNTASVIRDREIIAQYHKFSLPNHTVFDEPRYFTSGQQACVFEQDNIHFGVNICADVWHPIAPQAAAKAGAQILLVLNASPFHLGKQTERYDVVRQRIQEVSLSVVYCNLVGGQDELVFDGGSFVMNTHGELTQQFPHCVTGVYIIEFDGITPKKSTLLAPPTIEHSAYQALVLGLRDYVHKNGFPGVLLGLSGGVDSALTLAIAVDALGHDKVHAVMMPSEYTATISLNDARSQAKLLDVQWSEIAIHALFTQFLSTLAPEFEGRPFDLTEENLQARIRGTLLMALSNKLGKMVVSTGNKSEMAVGYATLYGDMVGGFALLRDVPKTLVYRLCAYRNALSPVIPQRVIERPPSAELRPDQTDQDSLPDYAILDGIIERYVEADESLEKIVAAGYPLEVVTSVIRMIDRSEYKRRQAPVGVRLTPRAFGKDRRYPITQGFSPFTNTYSGKNPHEKN